MSASRRLDEHQSVKCLLQVDAHITILLAEEAETDRTHTAWLGEPLLDHFRLRCVPKIDDEILDAGAVQIPLDRTFQRRANTEFLQRADGRVRIHFARLK